MNSAQFNKFFKPNQHKVNECKLIFNLNMLGYEYDSLAVSTLHYTTKLKQFTIYWRINDEATTRIFYENSQASIVHSLSIPFDIIIKTTIDLPLECISNSLLINNILHTIEGKEEHKLEYYSAFEDHKNMKSLKIGRHIPIFFWSKAPLILNESLGIFNQNCTYLKAKLNDYNLDLATVSFHQIFEKSFTKEMSNLLISLISLKTRTEELFDSLQNNIDFSLDLIQLMNETKSKNFEIEYINNTFLGTLLSENFGFFYCNERDKDRLINDIEQSGLIYFY